MDETQQLLEKALDDAMTKGDRMRAKGIADTLEEYMRNKQASSAIEDVASRAKVSTPRYIKDKIKQGPGDAIQTLDIVGNVLGSPKGMFTDPGKTFAEAVKVSQEDRKPVDDFFGVENLAPNSKETKYLGAAVGALSDPTSYIGGGGLIRKGLTSMLPSAGGVIGSDMAEEMGGGTAAQIGGALVGGGAGGVVSAGVGRAGRAVVGAAQFAKDGKGLIEGANKKLLSQAEEHVKNTILDAMKADPTLIQKIAKLQQEAKLVGKTLPIHVIGNNPVIKAAISTLARRDPTFAGLYARQYDEALDAISTTQGKVFGDPTQAAEKLQNQLKDPKAQQLERINTKLDNRAYEAGKPIAPFYNSKSQAEQLKMRMDTVDHPSNISPRSQPLYKSAIDAAEANQDALTPGSVQKIVDVLKTEKAENPFSSFPALWEVAKNKLQLVDDVPKVFSDSGAPPSAAKREIKPLDYGKVFDLKEAISLEYRRLNPEAGDYWAKRAELTKLRKVVDEGIETDFNPETVQLRKQADTQYAFDFTLKDISRRIFDSNGVLQPKALMKWLENPKNQGALNSLSDVDGNSLKELVKNPSIAVAKIMEKKDSVNGIYGRMQTARVLDASKMTPKQIKDRMAEDPKFVGEFLKTYGKNNDALLALRSLALDDIMSSPEPLVDLLKNKSKAQMYSRVFGPDYEGYIKNLASLSQRLAKNPADVGFDFKNAISKDRLDEAINVPLTQVFSKFRNPIISKWQALVELGSKAMTGRAEDAYEQSMKQLILDPQALAEYAKAIKPTAPADKVDPNKLLAWARKYGIGEAQNTGKQATRGAFLGLQDGVLNEVNPQNE